MRRNVCPLLLKRDAPQRAGHVVLPVGSDHVGEHAAGAEQAVGLRGISDEDGLQLHGHAGIEHRPDQERRLQQLEVGSLAVADLGVEQRHADIGGDALERDSHDQLPLSAGKVAGGGVQPSGGSGLTTMNSASTRPSGPG